MTDLLDHNLHIQHRLVEKFVRDQYREFQVNIEFIGFGDKMISTVTLLLLMVAVTCLPILAVVVLSAEADLRKELDKKD